jgi:hypothetical protein
VEVPAGGRTVRFPTPVDLHRNDGATDYVHDTDVDAAGTPLRLPRLSLSTCPRQPEAQDIRVHARSGWVEEFR